MCARPLWAFPFAAFYSAISLAALDPTDVVRIEATAGFLRDDNLFRLPDVDPALFGINPDNKSDTARILGLNLTLDKMLSRQRLLGELNITDTKYDKNTNLDNTGGRGRAAWLWQVGNYWSGEASYLKHRELGGFEDIRFLDPGRRAVKDIVDTDSYTLSGGYQFHPRWRVSAEFTDRETSHRVRQELNYKAEILGAELRYQTPANNSIGVQVRQTERVYPNRGLSATSAFDNGHEETRLTTVALWQLTGAVRLDAALGHTSVKHDVLSQRDFSGVTWRAGATWDPSSKLRFNLNSYRDVRLYEDNLASFLVVDGIGLSPLYAMTSKIVFRGDFTFERRDYRGTTLLAIDPNREDDVRLRRVGVTYSPIRNVDLSLTFERGDRRSTDALLGGSQNEYDYNAWFGTLKIGF